MLYSMYNCVHPRKTVIFYQDLTAAVTHVMVSDQVVALITSNNYTHVSLQLWKCFRIYVHGVEWPQNQWGNGASKILQATKK